MSTSQLLGTVATANGVIAAPTVLLQARQMVRAEHRASAVDAVGLLCGGLTLAVALSLRGSLRHPFGSASRLLPVGNGDPRSTRRVGELSDVLEHCVADRRLPESSGVGGELRQLFAGGVVAVDQRGHRPRRDVLDEAQQ